MIKVLVESTPSIQIGVNLNRVNGEKEVYFVGENHGTHLCSCALAQYYI